MFSFLKKVYAKESFPEGKCAHCEGLVIGADFYCSGCRERVRRAFMSVKHSTGPWVIKTEVGVRRFDEMTGKPIPPMNYHYVKDADGGTVWLCLTLSEASPNARLIAAAPELLEACKRLAGAIDSGNALEQSLGALEAYRAIAKATGDDK